MGVEPGVDAGVSMGIADMMEYSRRYSMSTAGGEGASCLIKHVGEECEEEKTSEASNACQTQHHMTVHASSQESTSGESTFDAGLFLAVAFHHFLPE